MTINSIHRRWHRSEPIRLKQSRMLTDNQKLEVASILSMYDSSALTADDAGLIINAFKEAGLEPGSSLFEAIEEEGFDPAATQLILPMILNSRQSGTVYNYQCSARR